jgi:hypothetical protein
VPGIPGVSGRPWYAREAWASSPAAGLALVAAAAAFVQEAVAPNRHGSLLVIYGVGVLGGIAVVTLNLLRSRYKDAREDRKDSPDDLRGCLHVIFRVLSGYKGVVDPADGWLRIAVYRVDGAELEQVVDYVGSGDRGSGRRFPSNAGLIGAVLTDVGKRALVFSRPVDLPWELWVEYLVQIMKMPRASAIKTRRDRFSFMAVPIPSGRGNVAGVVYGDAGTPGFFDPVAQGLFVQGCIGLAKWVNERYA